MTEAIYRRKNLLENSLKLGGEVGGVGERGKRTNWEEYGLL